MPCVRGRPRASPEYPGVKFLFDENLSPRLVEAFVGAYPGSEHVRSVGLASADDVTIWNYAKERGFVIVSKDVDVRQRSFRYGPPPKVVWLRVGNCSTDRIADTLRSHGADLEVFERDPVAGLRVLS